MNIKNIQTGLVMFDFHLVYIFLHEVENYERHFTIRLEISYNICAQFINAKTLTFFQKNVHKIKSHVEKFYAVNVLNPSSKFLATSCKSLRFFLLWVHTDIIFPR